MVRKFVLIKTNKEDEMKEYPAYVMHYTDFSPNRKAPLDREVMVSDSLEQIEALFAQSKQENVKKGWAPLVEGGAAESSVTTEPKATVKKKVTKKAASKKAATKKTTKKKTTKADAKPKKKKATKKKAK